MFPYYCNFLSLKNNMFKHLLPLKLTLLIHNKSSPLWKLQRLQMKWMLAKAVWLWLTEPTVEGFIFLYGMRWKIIVIACLQTNHYNFYFMRMHLFGDVKSPLKDVWTHWRTIKFVSITSQRAWWFSSLLFQLGWPQWPQLSFKCQIQVRSTAGLNSDHFNVKIRGLADTTYIHQCMLSF